MRSLLFSLALCLIICHSIAQPKPNVILLIGDGMGLSQISAAMYESDRPLNMERFKKIGFIKTHSAKDGLGSGRHGIFRGCENV